MKLFRLAGLVWAIAPMALQAATITITVESQVLPFSTTAQTGSFEVYAQVQTALGEDPPEVIGQGVALGLLEANRGVRFTDVDVTDSVGHPYVFAETGGFSGEVKGDYQETALCADFLMSGSGTLEDGTGLMKVDLEVAGGTTGTFHLNVVADEKYTYLGIDGNATLPYAVQNGTITIIPEPSALILLLGLVPGVGLLVRRFNHG